jgi:hypothetical protein
MDSTLSLAYSMYSNKGVYALLLGSGISRSSGIATGWEIVLDLIRGISNIMSEDCGDTPEKWYFEKFKQEPDYSILLDQIAKTATERSQLLKGYFEPTDDEREQGIKTPTLAHRSIANLVKQGFIKVIVTTNFDRLLEKALNDIGITPDIISNDDSIEGVMPLIHSKCTIIKVHGDYLDTRIKNTKSELESYTDKMNNLLDRVFDEFGLIICGWSGEWDIALKACIERCKSHRFTTYWTSITEPVENVKRLLEKRMAEKLLIKDADSFFSNLEQKVIALADVYKPHPLSSKVAVSILKRYINSPLNKIKIHDLIMEETNRICDENAKCGMNDPISEELMKNRIKHYEANIEILLSLFINGCYWGSAEFSNVWTKCIEQVANSMQENGGYKGWLNLRRYPSLLLLYGGGIASIASKNYHNLYAISIEAKCNSILEHQRQTPLILNILKESVVEDHQLTGRLFNMPGGYTPLSDYLHDFFRVFMKDIIPVDSNYDKIFDYFEYMLGLLYVDNRYNNLENENRIFGPSGQFNRKYYNSSEDFVKNIVTNEISKCGNEWTLLKNGFFNEDLKRAEEVKQKYDDFLCGISYH